MTICIRSLNAAILLLFAHCLAAQQSQWIHLGTNGHLVYRHEKNGITIPDYSFAGYRSGGVALPTVPAQVKLQPTGADDTAAIQAAIDAVSARPLDAKGFRGAIQLAPGVFHCSAALVIAASGVILRGAGSGANHDATTISLTGDPHVGIAIKGNFALKTISAATNITEAYVPFGAHTIRVADATHIHVGDLVQILKPVTVAWIEFMGMSSLERADRDEHWVTGTLKVRRRVAAVSGNAVTFQIALMDSYDSQFLGTEHFTVQPVAVSGQVEEAGVEDLRIVATPAIVGFHDAHTIAMEINAAADSWVRNVAMIDTTEGVRLDTNSERVTLTRVDVEQSTTVTSAARPFHFAISGTQVLVDRATGTGDKVTYFATEARQQGPVVILNSVFHGDGNLEPHQRWSSGLLVDSCAVPDGGIHLLNRGTAGSGHGWAMGWGVVWNSMAGNFILQQAPGTLTWGMGNRGPLKGQAMPDGNGGRAHGTPLPSGIIESQGKPVSPGSLYLAQLAERLGPRALKNIGYTTTNLRDTDGMVAAGVLHQNGHDKTIQPRDDVGARPITEEKAATDAITQQRFAEQKPAEGSEAAIRKNIADVEAGTPDYSRMSPELANAVRQQLTGTQKIFAGLGAIKSVQFESVDRDGADAYVVEFEHGRTEWFILLGEDGKIVMLGFGPM